MTEFKNGDAVTVQGLLPGAYEDMICDGSEGTVGMLWSGEGEMYGVEFSGVSGMLLLYRSELALTADLQPPTSRSFQVGDRVAQAASGHAYDGIPPETLGTVVEDVDDMYIEVEWDGMDWSLPMKESEIELIEASEPEAPTSLTVKVGDRVTATWGSFEGSVGTVRETKIAGGTGKPIASVIWDDAPWVYSEVLEVVEDEVASTDPVVGDRVIITNLSGNRTKSTFLGEGLLGTVTEVLPGHSGNIYWVAFHDQWGQDLMLSHEIRKVD